MPSHTFCQIQEIQATCYTAARTTDPQHSITLRLIRTNFMGLHPLLVLPTTVTKNYYCPGSSFFFRQLPKQYFSPCHSLLHLTSAAHYLPMSLLACWTWWRWMLMNRWLYWMCQQRYRQIARHRQTSIFYYLKE